MRSQAQTPSLKPKPTGPPAGGALRVSLRPGSPGALTDLGSGCLASLSSSCYCAPSPPLARVALALGRAHAIDFASPLSTLPMPVVPLASKRTSEAGLWDESKECTNCSKAFTLLNRRHHCRVCGHVFCAGCSAYRVRLASSRTGKEKRACATCFAVSGAGGGYEPLAPPTRPPSKSIVVGTADLALGQGRRTAADLGGESMSAELALAELRKPLGAYNWALFHPTATLQALRLHNAGSLSINGAWRAGPAGGTLFARLTHTPSTHTLRACPQSALNISSLGRRCMGCCGWGLGRGAFGAQSQCSSAGCPLACPRWQCRSASAWQRRAATWRKSWGPFTWSCRSRRWRS